ncbi:MAG: family 16 glycoside hydrolase [Planctomycetota bacterium]
MLSCVALLALFPHPIAQDPAGTVSLFDGRTLDGWSGDPRFWSVEDGTIVGRSTAEVPCDRTTYLVLEGFEFDDFDLSLEYRIDGGNSGVQFRSEQKGQWQVSGYQADLEDGPNWTGGIYEQDGRGVLVRRSVRLHVNGTNSAYELLGDPAEMSKLGGARAWHRYRIRAEGPRVRLWVDGTLTADLDDRDPKARRSGVLALQMHAGPPMEIRYRDLKITPLDVEPEPTMRWIWSPAGPETQLVEIERAVRAGKGLVGATLFAACDDGVEVALDDRVFAGGDTWSAPFEVDLPPVLVERLADGKPHRLSAECWNGGGPAGFVARLTLTYEDGTRETVETDRWWKVSSASAREFVPADDLGPYGVEPWGTPTERSTGAPDRTLPAAKIELLPGFEAEDLLRVPRAYGSWVALTVDDDGRILAAAEANTGLFRVTLDREHGGVVGVESLGIDIPGAQGLLAHGRDLYVVQNVWKSETNGLHRARDRDGDGTYDEVKLLRRFDGGGEHGAHAVRLTPDGTRLQVIAGNSTRIPAPIATHRVAPQWFDDQVLPSLPDTFGHGNRMHLHGGWTATCNLDGEDWELVATGMRNAYDFAYDAAGNAFAYDADMEWDIGAPWYRAPRVVQLAPGLEFGWRRGSGKIDASAPETFGVVCETGPASPVGVLHGKDGGFHAPYGDALFIGDWTRGTVYSIDLQPDGDTFTGTPVPFAIARPFPITDMEWLPDGSMVVATGGRGTRSALYRIRSTIDARARAGDAAPGEVRPVPPARSLAERQARARLELDPDVETWGARAVAERDPQALLALARVGGEAWQARCLAAVLDADEPLDRVALRTIELSLARWGDPEPDLLDQLRGRLEATLPAGDERANVAIVEVLVRLASPVVPAFAVPRLESAATQEVAIDYAMALRLCESGWTEGLARRYLDFLHVDTRAFRGGRSIEGYLDRIRATALETAGAALGTPYVAPEQPEPVAPRAVTATFFVKEWTLDDLAPALDVLAVAKDRAKGELAFRRGGCYACHRVGEEGGGAGPDLTDAGGRFTPRDLLVSILEPSRDVSDQYRDSEVWTHDGDVVVGRLIEESDEWVTVQLPPTVAGGSDGELVDVPREEVKLLRPSPTSRMPQGTLDGLQREEILEMLAWLLEEKR